MSRFRPKFTIRRLMVITALVALAFGSRSAWQRWQYDRKRREAIALAMKAFGAQRWAGPPRTVIASVPPESRGFWVVESAERAADSTVNVRFRVEALGPETDASRVETEGSTVDK